MAKPKLPKKLFVRWKEEIGDGHFLLPATNIGDLDIVEETVNVGLYELKKKVKVTNTTTIDLTK